jgi:hypothetical protein
MRKFKKILLGSLIMVMAYALTGCGVADACMSLLRTKVKLNKYITIETYGYDSVGKASYKFDYDSFEEDYGDKIKINKSAVADKSMLEYLEDEDALELMMLYCIEESLDKSYGLSNGDTVTLNWNCDDKYAENYFNCELVYSDIEYKVKDLEEPEVFNPFDHITVTYDGTDGAGSMVIDKDTDYKEMEYIDFSVDNDSNLSNGEIAKVTATVKDSYNFINSFGEIVEDTEKLYSVEGLPRYASSLTDISQDVIDALDDETQAYISDDLSWADEESIKNISLLGNYFLYPKDDTDNWSNNNYLYCIYRIDIENGDGLLSYYFYSYLTNITVLADGMGTPEFSYNWFTGMSGEYFYTSTGNYYYVGYEDLASLFDSNISGMLDEYEYESTVTDDKAAKSEKTENLENEDNQEVEDDEYVEGNIIENFGVGLIEEPEEDEEVEAVEYVENVEE